MKLKDVRGYVPPYPTMTEMAKTRRDVSYYGADDPQAVRAHSAFLRISGRGSTRAGRE
jgi:hypothetical protein